MNKVPGFGDIMDAFFGPIEECRLVVEDGILKIKGWQTEADLRRMLTQIAFMYGWRVRQEVVIPGWGRIDLVLHDPGQYERPILIELKVELKRPADTRRAFQQADGYGRWWKTNRNQGAEVVLCAADHIPDVVSPIAEAYPEVSFYSVSQVMTFLQHWRNPAGQRWAIARQRLEAARQTLALHEQAVADIDQIGKRA